MRRVVFPAAAVLVAVVLQTTLLDRLPFPGGAAPDLVLVLVVTLALASGPMVGMLIGFCAGCAVRWSGPPGCRRPWSRSASRPARRCTRWSA